MRLTVDNLQDILDIAKESVKNQDDCFGYGINGYHFFVYCDCYEDKDIWTIEPNMIDEDDCAEPIGDSVCVIYGDYAQLLIECAALAEIYFEED